MRTCVCVRILKCVKKFVTAYSFISSMCACTMHGRARSIVFFICIIIDACCFQLSCIKFIFFSLHFFLSQFCVFLDAFLLVWPKHASWLCNEWKLYLSHTHTQAQAQTHTVYFCVVRLHVYFMFGFFFLNFFLSFHNFLTMESIFYQWKLKSLTSWIQLPSGCYWLEREKEKIASNMQWEN